MIGTETKTVPFFDYKNAFKAVEEDFVYIFKEILGRGAFIMQKELEEFEQRLASYLGVKHAFGVGNATVKTVVSREKRLLEEIGKENTGRRGGQLKRYRLKDDVYDQLRSELEALYQDLPMRPESRPKTASSAEVPRGVLADPGRHLSV